LDGLECVFCRHHGISAAQAEQLRCDAVAMSGVDTRTRTLSDTDFTVPIDDRYFEDYQVGAVYEYGYLAVTEEDIVGFAEQFDPQPIHVDAAFAATGPFTGLIASGWHSAALLMRLFADHYLSRVASLASPGVDELRWAAPLRPGDQVRLRTTITQTRPSQSKPDRGMVYTHAQLLNQRDECPISIQTMNILPRREPAT
jgi:acyl dehydratase